MFLGIIIGIHVVIMKAYCDVSVDINDVIMAKCYSYCLKLFVDPEIKNKTKLNQLLTDLRVISASSFNKQYISRHYPSIVKKLADEMSIFVTTKLEKINQRTNDGVESNNIAESIKFMTNNQLKFYQNLIYCLLDKNDECGKKCIYYCQKIPIDQQVKKLKNSDGLVIITKPKICNKCFLRNDYGCVMACTFLNKYAIEETRPIHKCPVSSKITKTCPNRCSTNKDCSLNQQCCFLDGCGQICQNSTVHALPTYQPKANTKSNVSFIEFDWINVYKSYMSIHNPIVFILQVQTCFCKKFNSTFVKQWKKLLMTHKGGAQLIKLDNGTFYRVRLAAITILTPRVNQKYGKTSSYLPAKPYPPNPPGKPRNFRDTIWRSAAYFGDFNVVLNWDEEKYDNSDGETKNRKGKIEYKITWVVDHINDETSGETVIALTDYEKNIERDITSYEIEDLKPGTTYKVKAYSKLYWPGYGYISSSPAILFLTTPNINKNELMVKWSPENADADGCNCKLKNAQNLKQDELTIENGNINAEIDMEQYGDYEAEIQTEVCISHLSSKILQNTKENTGFAIKSFTKTRKIYLTNLEPHCRYSVIINRKHRFNSPQKHVCLCTYHCRFSNHPRLCFKEKATYEKLSGPSDLVYNLSNSDTLTYSIYWKQPSKYISPFPSSSAYTPPKHTKYRIMWGPRQNEPISLIYYQNKLFNPIIQTDKQFVKILSDNITQYQLQNLTQNTLYIVQIQSLYQGKDGSYVESNPSLLYLPTRGYKDIGNLQHNKAQKSPNLRKLHLILIILIICLS